MNAPTVFSLHGNTLHLIQRFCWFCRNSSVLRPHELLIIVILVSWALFAQFFRVDILFLYTAMEPHLIRMFWYTHSYFTTLYCVPLSAALIFSYKMHLKRVALHEWSLHFTFNLDREVTQFNAWNDNWEFIHEHSLSVRNFRTSDSECANS